MVKNMITFIEEKEKELQASNLTSESKSKNEMVNSILDRLEKEAENED